jgi:cytochrome c553
MQRGTLGLSLAVGVLGATLLAGMVLAAEYSPAQRDFILACAGCHGVNGVSHSNVVPSLQGLVGYYLNTGEGRAYLPRLPNVAFSTLSDEKLAAVLNFMVFDLGRGSAPAGAPPYDAAEVGRWRRQPLTEVTLSVYRQGLVETLIAQYAAPEALRVYAAGARLTP